MYEFRQYLQKRLLKEGADIFDPKIVPQSYDKRLFQEPDDDDYDPNFDPDDLPYPPDETGSMYPQFGRSGVPPYAQVGHTQGRLPPGQSPDGLPPGFQRYDPEEVTTANPDYEHMSAGEIYAELQAKMAAGEEWTPEEKSMIDVFRSASIRFGRKWKQMSLDEIM